MPIKNIKIEESKLRKCRVFGLLKGRDLIHEQYGLWICHSNHSGRSGAYEEPKPRYFEFYSISHLFKGNGWLWTADDGRIQRYTAGQAVLVAPNLVHDYTGDQTDYHEDSICFTGPVADQLHQAGIIQTGVMRMGSVRRLLPIVELAQDPAADAQIKANIALQNLLIDLYFENKKHDVQRRDLRIEEVIHEILKEPGRAWSITELAEMCNLSYNHFRRLFIDKTGLSPKKYIDRLKVRKASEELLASDDTIADIAANYGFDDPFHFSRRFKDILGLSPEHYRKRERGK